MARELQELGRGYAQNGVLNGHSATLYQLGSMRQARLMNLIDDSGRYPETRAALAQAERLGRITARHLRNAVTHFREHDVAAVVTRSCYVPQARSILRSNSLDRL
jgi:hypothetical protein